MKITHPDPPTMRARRKRLGLCAFFSLVVLLDASAAIWPKSVGVDMLRIPAIGAAVLVALALVGFGHQRRAAPLAASVFAAQYAVVLALEPPHERLGESVGAFVQFVFTGIAFWALWRIYAASHKRSG